MFSANLERFHLPKNSRNCGWNVNGTRLFGSFHLKFSGINGIPEKSLSPVPCGILSGQASLGSLEWNF